MDWITHDEDVWFEFRGDSPHQLTPGRYYKGEVDGFAEFGVFVDLASGVTGLLHRSELDRRLESLDWEAGDTVFVQVKNIRDNGNIDLGWSIRQSEREFRGSRIHDPNGEDDGKPVEESDDSSSAPVKKKPKDVSTKSRERNGESQTTNADDGAVAESDADTQDAAAETESAEAETAEAETPTHEAEAETDRFELVSIENLSDRVGDAVRIEGEVVSTRQTGGPTIFEIRDETGVVDCAAFVEAGVRAYPEVGESDIVRLDGEVEVRRDELQVETEELVALEGEEADAVVQRLDDAMAARARPDSVEPLAAHAPVEAVTEQLRDAAETVRRAILESRPIVVRHPATADGYVAGAAVERAVLPRIREEHERADAEYHYFTRRPLDDPIYGMDAATNDVTRMLQDNQRHDEKLPLVLLLGVGATAESLDGLGLLDVYGAERVVVDAAAADEEVEDVADAVVNPGLAGTDAADLSTGALGANLAAAVDSGVREDIAHLPAVSYWEDTPAEYVELAEEAGYDADRTRELREAIALEAYYQSYEDKRELITDLLFDDGVSPGAQRAGGDAVEGNLAAHIAEQFRIKLDAEVETAQANIDVREEAGVTVAVLDADAYTHRFDFPPTSLLVDELHRRNREGDEYVTVATSTDELFVRTTDDVDIRAIAEAARDAVPEGGVTAVAVRDNRIEFLSGARDEVVDAVVTATVDQF
ncbi:recj-like exonuclease with dnaj-type zn-finger domain [Halogeometricum borinquense DSM 11551]|uniref:RecJ-like exonuclease with DnaJ-type Zn-finger domain n=1 Tax=Halogeometricum borinquense (strain ATCC 700274 / DSM 11551 / JCM 10706 / KCTC 4070 / PR3) TaxID=469382 RepID=E4NSZ1_HALBP|nr:OB-fold nucleic acid binding domain-containing protein [Halogeometricum borinquense]ADQ66984.1 RecJ-like exonuclease with DnaJ-type Zn-finger domain [Halogeometricum borinquense DSM 11551]ELY29775.1 recj-like exonuclease with dnaj-type zn-finger domain [Halogeometricum borinquense DSM 11551]